MKRYTNKDIFIFASVMVIIVATILSVVAMVLQPLQKKNIEINKKQNILLSLNIEVEKDNALEKYDQYITNTYVVNHEGERQEDKDAFSIDLKKELDKPLEKRNLPIFVGTVSKDTIFIVPVRGKGLWGPIWGYVALEDDFNTVYGTNFSHKSETPGLGAEIATREFQKQFIGKEIFNDAGDFVSVQVKKGGKADGGPHEVDGISGGTITSKGVDKMLEEILESYLDYFKKQKNN